MIKVILLVCVTSIAPSDCNADNALYFLNAPDATNEVSCAMQSQAYLAQTWIGQSMADDEYLKIVCQSGARVRLQGEASIEPKTRPRPCRAGRARPVGSMPALGADLRSG